MKIIKIRIEMFNYGSTIRSIYCSKRKCAGIVLKINERLFSLKLRLITSLHVSLFIVCFYQPTLGQLESADRQNYELSAAQWREDIDSLYSAMKMLHPNAFHYTSEETFIKLLTKFKSDVPKLSTEEIFVRIKQFVSLVGDGHTFIVDPRFYHKYPLEFFNFENRIRLTKAIEQHKDLLGLELTKINGHPVAQILDSLNSIIPQAESSTNRLKDQMVEVCTPEHLRAFKFVRDLQSSLFEFTDGKKLVTRRIEALSKSEKIAMVSAFKTAPLFLSKGFDEAIWFRKLQGSTYYINFLYYPSWEQMDSICTAIYNQISADKSLKKIVIDMRQNGGGNFDKVLKVMIPMFQNVNALNPNIQYFVIIGRGTFSAAMSNTVHFRNCLGAILVGEPTGAKPNNYQENGWFTLLHSNIRVSISTRFYTFQKLNTDGVIPDQFILPGFSAYMSGSDPALDWILGQPE